jgi:hypothetical protein
MCREASRKRRGILILFEKDVMNVNLDGVATGAKKRKEKHG